MEKHPLLITVFQLSYILIKFAIKHYQPNELYASQWIEMIMEQAMYPINDVNILADATLTSLMFNNKKILETRIKKETISRLVKALFSKERH